MNKATYAVSTLALALVFLGCPDDDPPASNEWDTGTNQPDGTTPPDVTTTADVVPDAAPPQDADGGGTSPDSEGPDVTDPSPDADANDGGSTTEVIEDECDSDSDCEDLNECCTVGACVEGACVAQELEDCCGGSNSDCEDGDSLTTDVCSATCESGGCIHSVDVCPSAPLYISKNFDDASLQFLDAQDSDKTTNVRISLSKEKSFSPSWSLYLGDPTCQHYYNGPVDENCLPIDPNAEAAHGEELILGTPIEIPLAAEESAFLSFWVNMSAQPAEAFEIIGGDIITQAYDYLQVCVDDGSGEPCEIVYTSTDVGALGADNHTGGDWAFQTVDLTPWAGQDVNVRVAFTIDNGTNFAAAPGESPWYGVYLDDIVIQGTCDDASCVPGVDTCPEDISGCTNNTCTPFFTGGSGICAYQGETPGVACIPCSIPENCSDDACYVYECVQGMCQNLDVQCCSENSTFPVLTAPPDVAYEGFEDADIIDWPIEDPYEDDNVSWQIDSVAAYNGMYSLYFGDPETQTYDSDPPNPAHATAWTPFFEVDQDVNREQVASFWLWMSTEFDDSDDPQSEPTVDFVDVLTVQVQRFGDDDVADGWTSTSIGNTTRGGWEQIGVALSEYRGETVRLGFSFDSGDAAGSSTANGFGGVRIDDLTVASACESQCLSGSDCSDGDQCTADWCELGECVNGDPEPNCCTVDADCDDVNDCTLDTCVDGQCDIQYDPAKVDILCCEGNWPGETVASFEDSDEGYAIESDSEPVTWHAATGNASSGEASMNFSDPDTSTYESGGTSSGRMVSPPIQVPPNSQGNPYASFSFYMETEWNDNASVDFVTDIAQDELRVRVVSDTNGNDILDQDDVEEAEVSWVSHYTLNTTRGAWLDTRVNLDAYRGQDIQLVFEFDSGDGQKNAYAGPFIDDVSYGVTCLAPGQVQCIYAGECVPPDECKLPTCDADFKCGFIQKDTPECCVPTEDELKNDSFEDSADSWSLDTCTPEGADTVDDASMWQITPATAGFTAKDGDQLLYFGNGVNYGGDGFGSCGIATSPAVTLTAGVPWTVEFWLHLDIEKHSACPDGGLPTSDAFAFRVIDETTGLELLEWTKEEIQCSDYGKWAKRDFNLDEFAGKTVRLEFSFDTYDSIENEGKGIAIDDIVFIEGCPEF